ncbi:MAG TPA: hypothetical protein VFT56_01020 [Sphingomonas sp.]|nr:hypothetical protein [Sphingomonas sp.]
MTDLVVSVKLKADGSGLVGQARAAKAEVAGLGSAAVAAGADAQRLAAGAGAAEAATRALTTSAGQVSNAMEVVATSTRQAAAASDKLATDQAAHTRAVNDNIRSIGQQKAGYFALGQNLQDVGVQLSMGTSFMRVMALQGGQLASAIDMIGPKGAFGRLASFLAGPEGAVVFTVGVLLAPVIGKLLEENDALEQQEKDLAAAASAADSFGAAQSLIGKVIDLATGRLKTHNLVLIETIKLQARAGLIAAREDQKTATDALAAVGKPTLSESVWDSIASFAAADQGGSARDAAALANRARNALGPLKSVLDDYAAVVNRPGLNLSDPATVKQLNDALETAIGKVDTLQKKGQLGGRDPIDSKKAILALGTAINDQIANQEALDALEGKGIAADLVPWSKPHKSRSKKARSTAALDEFGRDAADKIAGILDQFDQTPPAVKQANAAVRQLDDLIDDLQRKKPPNFEALIAGAERAKTAVEQGLNRPITEFVVSQERSLAILQLQVAGFDDQAEAQRTINALEAQRGPLTEAQKDAVLATVQALTAEERQLDIIHQKQQRQLAVIADVRKEITDTIYGGIDALQDLPERLLDTFKQYTAQFLTEQIFGPELRKLEDQITGTKVVASASERMAAAIDETNKPILSLGEAAGKTATALADMVPSAPSASQDVIPQSTLDAIDAILSPIGGGTDALRDIIVSGKRIGRGDLSRPKDLIDHITQTLLKPLRLDKDTVEGIGKFAGKGFVGAMAGEQAAGLANLIGIRTNNTTATAGGAIGGIVGGPIGGAIGGLIGGVLGGLFHKTKQGGAVLTSTSGDASTFGNSRAQISAAGDAADQVQQAIAQIADQLGGSLGNFDVSIGTYNGKWRVNPSGGTKLGGGGGKLGNVDFGKDGEADAVAYAIMDAIKDGAVTGLSAAVQQALHSSTDINKALQEALKVQDLETLIGGVTGQLDKLFKDADAQAKERVDLARKYGLDVLAVEKANADERAKLIDQTMQQSVGSLQDLLDNLQYGDLFEGSAADRRQALLDQIDELKPKAQAGDADAANQLAALYNQLVTTSRDAYGTAGDEYAGDRNTAVTGAQDVIQAERDRINQAAGITQAQTDALLAGNDLANEANDLLAGINSKLDQIAKGMAAARSAPAASPNLALTMRRAVLGLD